MKKTAFCLLITSVIIGSCIRDNDKMVNKIFPDFKPLIFDSTIYFNIQTNKDSKSYYEFNQYSKDSLYFSHISFGHGEIRKQQNRILLSIVNKRSEYNIKEMELFNFNLNKGEEKKCYFILNKKNMIILFE